jgi:anti-anti-sigma factor
MSRPHLSLGSLQEFVSDKDRVVVGPSVEEPIVGSVAQDIHDAVPVRSRYDLTVATGGSSEVRVVEAAGSVDLRTVAELAEYLDAALADDTASIVVVDLRRVDFLAAAGLRVLMAADRRARAQNTTLRVRADTHAVSRALRVTGLDQTLKVY